MPLDREKLLKLLRLTTSDKVHEVAGAMRACNRLLEAAGETWEQVLTPPEKALKISIQREQFTAGENWVAPHLKDKVMIDLMFRTLYSQPRTGSEDFWRWVDDVHSKFGKYGQLTQGQYQALRKCYQRATRT